MTKSFADTNLLLYAVSHYEGERKKAEIARRVLLDEGIHLSVQVLNEFIANAIKPKKLGLSRHEATLFCSLWEERYTIHPLTSDHLVLAREWFVPGLLSWWDSLIVASANLAGCEDIFSEDLNAGEKYGSVRVVNPFDELS